MNGIAAVQARIAAIESRFGVASPSPAPVVSAPTSGSAFAAEYAAADARAAATQAPAAAPMMPLGAGAVARPVRVTPPAQPAAAAPAAAAPGATHSIDHVDTGGPVPDTVPFAELFHRAGVAHGIPPRVLAAVGFVESRYQTDAVSSAGAIGVMQLMPETAASLGVDPRDPAAAIDASARLLRSLQDRFGSLEVALGAYNVGPGTIANAGGVLTPGSQAEHYAQTVLSATGSLG